MKRPLVWLIAAFASFGAAAQAPGTDTRGSTPPGMSQDGARPADGAITGGSILPGERAGIPGSGGPKAPTVKGEQRCMELSGALREQCLQQERGSSTGATRPSNPAREEGPSTAPPPTTITR